MSQAALIAAPEISVMRGSDFLQLDVTLALEMREPQYQVGISAIVEERGGRRSFWALNHPSGEPDFHHPDCFALKLPPLPGPLSSPPDLIRGPPSLPKRMKDGC
jgi:hypothetical protein